jgi:drug/metabolite transporter (DMT)-like permease
MNERTATQVLVRNVIIFVIVAVVGVVMTVNARTIEDSFAQAVVMHLGAAIFGAGLTFFLIQMMAWERDFGKFRD